MRERKKEKKHHACFEGITKIKSIKLENNCDSFWGNMGGDSFYI